MTFDISKPYVANSDPISVTYLNSQKPPSLRATIEEIWSGLLRVSSWWPLAREDLRDRFQRSKIGLMWVPLSFLAFLGVKILIFSKLNSTSFKDFTVFVLFGYWVWVSLVSFIVEGCTCFSRSGGYLKTSPLPYSVYVFQMIARNLVTYALNFAIVLLVYICVSGMPTIEFLWVLPVSIMYIINATWVGFFLGSVTARFRDILHFVQTMMRMLFFLTPVLWIPSQLGNIGELVSLYNPLSHYIAIMRDPIITGSVPIQSWFICGIITIIGLTLSLITYSRTKQRIILYV